MLVNNDDMCRCQGDHRRYVKDACKHTRQHEGTMMHELHGVVNRMDAVGVLQGLERASTVIARETYGYGAAPYPYPYGPGVPVAP